MVQSVWAGEPFFFGIFYVDFGAGGVVSVFLFFQQKGSI